MTGGMGWGKISKKQGGMDMVRELMHDPLFLGRKSRAATKEDLAIGQDLLETLVAHKETCVGMAGNMIGETVAVIAFFDGKTPVVMYNPEILKAEGEYETEEGCLSLLGGPGSVSAIARSRSAGTTRIFRNESRTTPTGRRRSSSMRWITAWGC